MVVFKRLFLIIAIFFSYNLAAQIEQRERHFIAYEWSMPSIGALHIKDTCALILTTGTITLLIRTYNDSTKQRDVQMWNFIIVKKSEIALKTSWELRINGGAAYAVMDEMTFKFMLYVTILYGDKKKGCNHRISFYKHT